MSTTTAPGQLPAAPLALLSTALSELAAVVARPEPLDGTDAVAGVLDRVIAALPPTRWASVTACTGAGRSPATIATSGEVAARADALQYATGHGPCLQALANGSAVTVADLTHERRWPDLAHAAAEHSPVRAVLSAPIITAHGEASLNLYADTPGAYSATDHTLAALTAATTALALTALEQRERARRLEAALHSNRRIGAAIGVLMARHHHTYEQAFQALRTASSHTNRKLRDIADDVLFTGALPGHG
jgi:GAF domain-containing protein